ncbi:MAG: POTRA domain-containing protein, partial [Pseudomonadota bacterium]
MATVAGGAMSLKRKTRSASLAAIWLAALAAFMSGAPSFAQAPTGAAPGQFTNEIITTIQVRGNERIEPETIGSYLAVAPGQPFDPALIDLSLKTLFRTGLFADVRMSQEGSALIIQVRENPIINRVVFEGNKKL